MKLNNILVKRVGELKTGTSKTTGKAYANRDILLGWTDETGENYIRATIDAGLLAGSGIEAGNTVQVELSFHTFLTSSGIVANEARVLKINETINS